MTEVIGTKRAELSSSCDLTESGIVTAMQELGDFTGRSNSVYNPGLVLKISPWDYSKASILALEYGVELNVCGSYRAEEWSLCDSKFDSEVHSLGFV